MNRRNTPETFWARVDTSAGPDGCWPWRGHCSPGGYGTLSWSGKWHRAHRVAYQLVHGWQSIPAGHHLHHRCGTPHCVNPRHLEPLSAKEHCRLTAIQHSALTAHLSEVVQEYLAKDFTCIRLHPPKEIAYQANGKRYCRGCCRERRRRYQEAVKQDPHKLAAQRAYWRAHKKQSAA